MPDVKIYWKNVKALTAELMGVQVRLSYDGQLHGKEGGPEVPADRFEWLYCNADVIVGYSLKTPDGGKDGRLIAMRPFELAKAMLEKRFRLATEPEIARFEEEQAAGQKAAALEAQRNQIKLTVSQSGSRLSIEDSPDSPATGKARRA